jgi:hypothetical protein
LVCGAAESTAVAAILGTILVGKPKERVCLEDEAIDGRLISKCILKTVGRLIWLIVISIGELL